MDIKQKSIVLLGNYFNQIIFLKGIIIGDPKRLDGGETHGTQHAKAVFEKISNLWPSVEIHWVDERFTSQKGDVQSFGQRMIVRLSKMF